MCLYANYNQKLFSDDGFMKFLKPRPQAVKDARQLSSALWKNMACQCELEYAKLKALEKSTNRRVMARGELGPNSKRFAVSSDEVWLVPAYNMVLERIDNDEEKKIKALDSKLGDLREQYRKLCWSFCVERTPNEDYARLAYENLAQQMGAIQPRVQSIIYEHGQDRGSASLRSNFAETREWEIAVKYTRAEFLKLVNSHYKGSSARITMLFLRRFWASSAFSIAVLGTMAALGATSHPASFIFGLGATLAYYAVHPRLVEPLIKKLILKWGEKKAQKTAAPNAIAATDMRRLVARQADRLEYDIREYSLFEKAADAELKVGMGIGRP